MPLTKVTSGMSKVTSTSKSANYTVLRSDGLILCDTSSAFTLTMPAEADVSGQEFLIRKTSSDFNKLTVNDDGASEITGLHTVGETVRLYCDGTSWFVLDRYIPQIPTSYTPAANWSTNVTHTAYWTRIGNRIRITFSSVLSGTNTDGGYTIGLPSGLSFDSTNIAGGLNTRRTNFGNANLFDNSSSLRYACRVNYEGGSAISVNVIDNDNTTIHEDKLIDSSTSVPIVFASSDNIQGWFEVEIDEWDD